MNTAELQGLKAWLLEYADHFVKDGPLAAMARLKLAHSLRVAREARTLSVALGWPQDDQNTAEALGLLHDAGRFSQLADYGTLSDARSINHALRGWEVISKENVLVNCSARRQRQILDGVLHHNAMTIPEGVHADSLDLVRLIRDADKLDIFNIFLDALKNDKIKDHPEIALGMSLDGPPNPELLAAARAGKTASYRLVKSVVDWKILQVCWVYDLHYAPAFRIVQERRIIEEFAALLPDTPDIREIVTQAQTQVAARVGAA